MTIYLYFKYFLCATFYQLLSESYTLGDHDICQGRWKQHVNESLLHPFHHILGLKKSFDDYHSNDEILKEICPVEIFQQNCFYMGITNRTNNLMGREWDSKSKDCHHFSAHGLLSMLRNRTIWFMGDSTMIQAFNSMVCTLMATIKHVKATVNWSQVKGGDGYTGNTVVFSDRTCPLHESHCHHNVLNGTSVLFPEYNATIHLKWFVSYNDAKDKTNIIGFLKSVSNDVVVFNTGLHYNNATEYRIDMNNFRSDYDREVGAKLQFYFLESTPQHFATDWGNGYFNGAKLSRSCVRIPDLAVGHQMDYRNRIIEEVFDSKRNLVFNVSLQFINLLLSVFF
jgi:hypothetical protein